MRSHCVPVHTQPENLLLASKQSDVNVKLADFGFAKHTSQRLDTVCGTPDYIAPEVCALLDLKKVPRSQRPPYNELCDIWSAGVVRKKSESKDKDDAHESFDTYFKYNKLGVIFDHHACYLPSHLSRLLCPLPLSRAGGVYSIGRLPAVFRRQPQEAVRKDQARRVRISRAILEGARSVEYQTIRI